MLPAQTFYLLVLLGEGQLLWLMIRAKMSSENFFANWHI